ncbi:M20 family metallo-hydrolase [Micromonospora echinofusca]|uniref:Hydantoinase/carbamoylase family amidase n=1 Tax=Micromonospora echinofusca TaxID=47858 RepID=A0ABS3VIS1_MICEH|nr:M20 family metallo-hydrolase [Micromonospora echinofusca]MBO4204422.1 hydantoinase/carbamoylase family amidase [Micromonospora echinofusca]
MLTRVGHRVDRGRLLGHLNELARFGGADGGGVSREGFGEADNAARAYLTGQAESLGLTASVDPAGNLLIRRRRSHEPERPVLLFGSHLDSVTNGGRYDGAYGVVAALEVLAHFAEHPGPMAYEPVAVAFANEEGALFPCPFFGSKALVGMVNSADGIVDHDGRPLRAALSAAGGDPDALATAAWPAGSIGAFLELHVEQGPILERCGTPIGIVDVVTGRSILDITLNGRQNHAGTTPMDARCDALVAAAKLIVAIENLAREQGVCSVATVGTIDSAPNVTNVIPGSVTLTAEIRDGSPQRLAAAERAILQLVAESDTHHNSARVTMRSAPTETDPRIRACVAEAAAELGFATMGLSSGAGHDAQIIAAAAPVAVIFVPSRDGISHAPAEHTDPEDLVAGADVLLGTVRRMLFTVPAPGARP